LFWGDSTEIGERRNPERGQKRQRLRGFVPNLQGHSDQLQLVLQRAISERHVVKPLPSVGDYGRCLRIGSQTNQGQ